MAEAVQARCFLCLHDLTHFAVESVHGLRHGFFGLVADGWDIADTEGNWVCPMPSAPPRR
jgi:hypothetical protein